MRLILVELKLEEGERSNGNLLLQAFISDPGFLHLNVIFCLFKPYYHYWIVMELEEYFFLLPI